MKLQGPKLLGVYVRYQDDGPTGICGQTTDITSPWDKLFIVDDYDQLKDLEALIKLQHRLNGRITTIWEDYDVHRIITDLRGKTI